jgi:phage replication initiation protein
MNVIPIGCSDPRDLALHLPDSNLFTAPPRQQPTAALLGPSSNTGQKSNLSEPIIDFCTVVFDQANLPDGLSREPSEIVRYLFVSGDAIACGAVMDRPFNFYPRSCVMVDATGSVCGRIGLGNDSKMCISLTGQGCQHVKRWPVTADLLDQCGAKLTRCDIAVDDLTGETFDLNTFRNLYNDGAFTMNGRPPLGSFVDDLGTKKGCSLYVGQKGHKQLNVYEKGKQLGDPESPHVRCELRLYAKRYDLPIDALRNPAQYYAGAYPMLAAFVVGEAERLHVKEIMVNATAKAMVRFLRNQAGTALHLVMDALGDEAVAYLVEHVARPGRPGRFKNTAGDLAALVRDQLRQSQPEELAA